MNHLPDFSSYGYIIEAELGSNRAGGRVTYLATSEKLQQQVVIKQFQFAKSTSSWTEFDAYQREIQVLKSLNHPGIPQYLDSFQTSDGFCMVQEYKNAQSLALLRSFSSEEIKQIAVSALKILVYLQNQIPPVIHRDIKPANILVDEQSNVYLVDFGFARVGDGEVGVSSVVKGTLGFMPPEQLFNRQLTEASDLYGLGMTLICLLTNTKADEIGNLVDISYRVEFKHLVPKLGVHWVRWLGKMVEPRLKDRFSDAVAALEAMPTHPIRPPEVRLTATSLEFRASRVGEKLTQELTIHNPFSDVALEGSLDVAPHASDPPHTPNHHAWILVDPKTFASNKVTCRVTVDTSKLMAEKTFLRALVLRTNSLPEMLSIPIRVHTASVPIQTPTLQYGSLAILFAFSIALTWFLASVILIIGTAENALVTAAIAAIAGLAVGCEASAWMLASAGAMVGATTGVMVGITIGTIGLLIALSSSISSAGLAMIAGTAIGFVCGLITGIAAGTVAESQFRKGVVKGYALTLALMTLAAAASLGLSLKFVGSFYGLIAIATNLLWIALLIYPPLEHIKLVTTYRKTERRLIGS